MIIGLIVILIILTIVFVVMGDNNYSDGWYIGAIITFILALVVFIFGCFHGFINHAKTERNSSRCYYSC